MDSVMVIQILAGILVLVLCLLYFYPTFKALGKRNTGAIFALNLLTGWTTIGWVLALIWALKNDAVALRPDEVQQFTGRDRRIKGFHRCPVKSRTESTGCQYRLSRYGSPYPEVPVKWAFSRTELG